MDDKHMVVLTEGQLDVLVDIIDSRRDLVREDSINHPGLHAADKELELLWGIKKAISRKAKIY